MVFQRAGSYHLAQPTAFEDCDVTKTGFATPFDGAISAYLADDAPENVRQAIAVAKKGRILSETYPHQKRLPRGDYEKAMAALQIELVKMQSAVKSDGQRIAIVFEGRDAAGKGGTIKRIRENLNPRGARVVALSKPSDTERAQWFFQRYIQHLPSAGELVLFDRSWYNRGVVERVFGFSTEQERARFFDQVPEFEDMLIKDGITLIKLWLNVGRTEQLRRFLDRESDPLKHWKLSSIDVKGLALWDEYTAAIRENFARSHTAASPWHVIRSDDKRRARISAISTVLRQIDYAGKDEDALSHVDDSILGGPELIHDA